MVLKQKKKAYTNCTAQPRSNFIKEKLLFRKSFVNFCRHVISMIINHTGNLFFYFYALLTNNEDYIPAFINAESKLSQLPCSLELHGSLY